MTQNLLHGDRSRSESPGREPISSLLELRPGAPVEAVLDLVTRHLQPVTFWMKGNDVYALSRPLFEALWELRRYEEHRVGSGLNGTDLSRLTGAVASTRALVNEWGCIYPERVPVVSLRRWIAGELALVSPVAGTMATSDRETLLRQCAELRTLFGERPDGVRTLEHERRVITARLELEAAVHSSYRLYLGAIRRATADLESGAQPNGVLRRLFYEIASAESHALVRGSGVKSAFGKFSADLLRRVNAADVQLLLREIDTAAALDVVHGVSRSVSNRLPRTANLGADVSVEEYRSRLLPPKPVLDSIAAINAGLLIDRERFVPQYGFGRPVPIDEIQAWTKNPGVSLNVISIGGVPVGYFVIFAEPKHLPDCAIRMGSEHPHLFERHYRCGWAEIVGVSNEGRDLLSGRGASAGDILYAAMRESARTMGLDRLVGHVREGSQANLSKTSSLKRFFEETGCFVRIGGVPYHALVFNLFAEVAAEGMLARVFTDALGSKPEENLFELATSPLPAERLLARLLV